MSLPEFQTRVEQFVSEHQLGTSVEIRLLDLQSELGEAAKEALKGSQYGSTEFIPTHAWQEELADVFFSLVCVANSTGVNLEEALGKALEKYAGRIKQQGEASSGR